MRTNNRIQLLRNVILAFLLTAGGGLLAQNTLTNGLVVYLNFDGNINAQGGTTNNGVAVGGNGVPVYTNGVIGQAAMFNNNASAGTVDDWAVDLGFQDWIYSNSWSYSLWVKITDPDTADNNDVSFGNKDFYSRSTFGWAQTDIYGWELEWGVADTNGNYSYYGQGGQANTYDGNWHHVVVTWDTGANLISIYTDGTQNSTKTWSTTGNFSLSGAGRNPGTYLTTMVGTSGGYGTSTNAGGSGPGSEGVCSDDASMQGAVDDVGIWTRVLTAAEVSAIYNAGLQGKPLTSATTNSPPFFVIQPSSETQTAGLFSGFSAKAGGTPPLSYQWARNGVALAGATANTLVYPVALSDSGASYTVVVSNSIGSITSSPPAILTVTAPPPPASITNGLVVYLNFDNNINAQDGTTNNGTAVSGSSIPGLPISFDDTGNGVPEYTSGIIGSAAATFYNYVTPGVQDTTFYISDWACSLGNIEWLYSNSWSFSLWVNTATTNQTAAFGNKDWQYTFTQDRGWVVSEYSGDWLQWAVEGGANNSIGNFAWNDGNWHHLAGTFDRGVNMVVAYADGVPTGNAPLGVTGLESLTVPNIMNTLVGGSGNSDVPFYGSIDDLAMWQRPLSEAEIIGIYQAGIHGKAVPQAAYPQPSLSVTLAAGGGSVNLIYPGWAVTYAVESSPSLAPASWSPVAGATPLYMNGNTVVNVPVTSASGFFRLRH